MRIVHLISSDAGGAGRAAYRLHKGLLAAGDDSRLVVKFKTTTDPLVECAPCHVPRKDYIALGAEIISESHIEKNRSELSNTHYSLGYPGYDISDHPRVLEADIIHLH